MYRTPQRPELPRDEIERLSIARYTKAWRLFTLVLSIVFVLPLGPVLVLELTPYRFGAGAFAATGFTLLVMALTLMRQQVLVEANYTRGELTVTPPHGQPRRVLFVDIEDVDTDSISDSELIRVTLTTRSGPVRVVDGMAVDEPVRRIKAMRQKAARLAKEAAEHRAKG